MLALKSGRSSGSGLSSQVVFNNFIFLRLLFTPFRIRKLLFVPVYEKSFFFSHSDLHTCSRIECDWQYEFLCGDHCLGILNTCYCGNDSLPLNKAGDKYCCQEPNTSCRTKNGDIQCQGQVLLKNQTCHGFCTQDAEYGFTMLPCDDQKECYTGYKACKGKPLCTE